MMRTYSWWLTVNSCHEINLQYTLILEQQSSIVRHDLTHFRNSHRHPTYPCHTVLCCAVQGKTMERRGSGDEDMQKLKVFLRIRPLTQTEKDRGEEQVRNKRAWHWLSRLSREREAQAFVSCSIFARGGISLFANWSQALIHRHKRSLNSLYCDIPTCEDRNYSPFLPL